MNASVLPGIIEISSMISILVWLIRSTVFDQLPVRLRRNLMNSFQSSPSCGPRPIPAQRYSVEVFTCSPNCAASLSRRLIAATPVVAQTNMPSHPMFARIASTVTDDLPVPADPVTKTLRPP